MGPSFILQIVAALTLTAVAMAYPYAADEQEAIYDGQPVEYVRLIPLRRVPRAAHRQLGKLDTIPEGAPPMRRGDPHYIPQRNDLHDPSHSFKEPITAETGHGHSSHPYDYVDYGAYTGGYGAFGWYSDHPVGNYH